MVSHQTGDHRNGIIIKSQSPQNLPRHPFSHRRMSVEMSDSGFIHSKCGRLADVMEQHGITQILVRPDLHKCM